MAWYALAFALFVLLQVICVVPHELGHALAALLVNMRLFTISIGSFGKIVYVPQILGYDVVFRSIPLGGSVLVAPKSRRFVRLRFLLVYLCGPMANALLMGFAIWLGESLASDSIAYWACSVFVWTNAIILLSNLFPRRTFCGGQLVPNDGLALLTIPFMSQATIDAWYLTWLMYEGLESRQRYRNDEAKLWFDRAVAFSPENASALSCLGIGLLDLRQHDEARKLFANLAGRDDQEPDARAMCDNNLAWGDFMSGNDEFVSEALICSGRAMERFPWLVAFKVTRGSVLMWAGDVEPGIDLLEEALEEYQSPNDRASNAAALALAMQKRGDQEQANRYLKMARDLDPTCYLLERAEQAIETTTAA